jgi:transcriptional regulator with XRE-family HTH domain
MPSQEASQARAIATSTVAANVDRGMVRMDLNNRQLADRIGATEHQVWRWRRGKHLPSVETLVHLADVLFDGDMAELYASPKRSAA